MKPVLQALVLAERVYEDVTGKKIIAGTFNRVLFSHAPPTNEMERSDGTKTRTIAGAMHGGFPYAYISLTDVCEDTKLQLQFVNLTKNQVLLGKDLTIGPGDDRLSTVELVVALPPLPISEAGTYAFEVVCEGEILGSYRITAEELRLP